VGNKKAGLWKKWSQEFLRFNLVGLFNLVVASTVYVALIAIGFNYVIALSADYIVGMVISFVLNKNFTFRISQRTNVWMILRMISVYIAIFIINIMLLLVFIDTMKFNPYISQAIAIFVIVIISFSCQKFFVFKKG